MLLLRLDRLLAELDGPAEVIFVDDGSTDCSSIVLRDRALRDDRFRLIRLSRNFGHQIAIAAGLDHAGGDAVIAMDGDFQDPPEVVLQLAAKWREGYDVVCAKRVAREGESRFKEATAKFFYRAVQLLSSIDIPLDVGDFRLVDRKALERFVTMRERERFVRGMFAWLGFKYSTVPYSRAPRAAAATKYPLRRMLRLAADALIGFSDAPLQFARRAVGE
jgi:dolichol-phosphate mannosyltransferase